ncbi:MAG: V-type ATPase subunit [Thomasclavelia sp.]|nr:V-type ATPase subunit [Thomasclavelia sp.]
MAFSSNALCAKAKAMYGGRLTEEEYDDLCRKTSISDLVTYLKSQTSYSNCLKSINVRNVHRGQVENAIMHEFYNRATKLLKYAPTKNQEFYFMSVMRVENRIIIEKLISLKNKEARSFDLNIPDYLVSKMSFNVYGLVNIEDYKGLLQYLEKTRYYNILASYNVEGEIDINAIQHDLTENYYDYYISTIKKNFKGSVQKELMEIVYTVIELDNITTIYRYKEYFHEQPEKILKSIHPKYTRMPKAFLDKLVNASGVEEIRTLLHNSIYANYADDKNYIFIEYFTERIQYNLAKRYMRFSSSAPLVYMTYNILQQIEGYNLDHIIEGIRYSKSSTEIMDTLIYA